MTREKSIPVGQCYPWAFAATARLPDARLVHGRVRDPVTGKRYGHAWIEDEGQVLDWQTMEIGMGPHPFVGYPGAGAVCHIPSARARGRAAAGEVLFESVRESVLGRRRRAG